VSSSTKIASLQKEVIAYVSLQPFIKAKGKKMPVYKMPVAVTANGKCTVMRYMVGQPLSRTESSERLSTFR